MTHGYSYSLPTYREATTARMSRTALHRILSTDASCIVPYLQQCFALFSVITPILFKRECNYIPVMILDLASELWQMGIEQ